MKKIIKEFMEFSEIGDMQSLGRAEVYANLQIGLLHAEIGDIITTPKTKEIYVVTKNSWGNDEYTHKVARAFSPDNMADANKYSQEVKDKHGQQLREEEGQELIPGEEGTNTFTQEGGGELPDEQSGDPTSI